MVVRSFLLVFDSLPYIVYVVFQHVVYFCVGKNFRLHILSSSLLYVNGFSKSLRVE